MTTFYVGQRVRIIHSEVQSRVGMEAVIIGGPFMCRNYDDVERGVHLQWELRLLGYTPARRIGYRPDQLEPLTPSGHQPAELSVQELLPFLKSREKSNVA